MKAKLLSIFNSFSKKINVPILVFISLFFFSDDVIGQCSVGQTQIMTDACAAATSGWTFTNGTTTTIIQQTTYWLVEKTADVITSPNYTVNGSITIRFQTGTFGTVGAGPNRLIAEYNSGAGWTSLGTTTNPTSSTLVTSVLSISGNITSSTFQIRFRNTSSTAPGIRLDNIFICETPPAVTPTISTTGTLSTVNTTYGTASALPSTFSVSGANMTAGILVTPPSTSFEVSLSSGSGYANTITVGAAGTIASTAVYIRLKPTATFTGSPYSGNVVLSSSGATSVNVATAFSTVTRKGLTITGLTGANKVYDRLTTASFAGTPSYLGLENSESFSVTGTAVANFANASVETGKAITIIGYTAPSTNYTITQPTGLTADITSKSLTIIGILANNKVFDASTTAALSGTATLSGVESGDTVTLGGTPVATFASSAVATGIAVTVTGYTIGGTDAGNYSITQPAGLTADITSASAPAISTTGTLLAVNTTYGSASASPATFDVSGVNMTAGILVTPPSTNFEVSTAIGGPYTNTITVGAAGTIASTAVYIRLKPTATVAGSPYSGTIVLSSSGASNVNVATVSSTVTAKGLTIIGIAGVNKVYDRSTTAAVSGTPSYVGLENAESFSVTGTLSASFITATVGTGKTITITGNTAPSTNYALTQPTGLTADITQKALTIAGAAVTSKSYTGTNPATITGGSLVGVVSPDVVNFSGGGTFASVNVGTGIAVTTVLTLGGSDAGNYSLTQPTLTGNITAAPLTITGLTGANKVYNSNTTASFTGTPAYAGLQNSESFLVTGSPTATFATKTVANAKPITVTGYTAPSTNYTVTQPTLSGNITVAPLSISSPGANNKVYTGTNPATLTGTLSGVIGADAVTLNLSGTFASVNVGTGIVVTSNSTLSNIDAGNYTLTQPIGLTANITQAPLTATADNKTKNEGAVNPALTITYSGFVNSETVAVITAPSSSTTAITASTVGTYPITLSGGSATNYSITLVNGTLTVNPVVWEDFETGTKGGYAAANVVCTAGSWNMSDALIGTSASDRKNGSKSVRIQNTGIISMNFNRTAGIGTVNILHAIYGTDSNSTWQLEASTDNGTTWTAYVSAIITTSSTTLVNQAFTVNLSGNVRLRIVKLSGGGNRISFDDIYVTDYNALITTGIVSDSPFCAGTTGVSVPFTYTLSANFPNGTCTFTAQLSDASGLFGTPVNLQSVTSDASGSQSISATIPSGTITGTAYRIRVVSTAPSVTGADNLVNITINNSATSIAPATTQNIVTSANGTTLTVTEGYTATNRQWKYGTVSGGPYGTNLGTASTQIPNFAVAGTYYIICESTYGAPCSNTVTSNEVQIVVTTPVPEINVVGNSVTIVDNDLTPTTTDHTDFSNVAWGATFTRTYTIQNTGTGTLTITLPIVIGGAQALDYAVTTPPSATIAPGGSSNFIVTFTPAAIGARAGSITINNDDSNEAIYNFNIQGTGTPSNLSTIEFNTSTTPQNIDYSLVANQANDLVSTSLAVMEFRIRDGGATNTDADNLGTTLNAITLNITNWANLKRLALYNGTTEIAEAAVTGPTLTFSGLTGTEVTAPDNGNRTITVRVSFQTAVTDNQQFSFSFGNSNVTALSTNSQFATFSTVNSETTADRNRIEVTADRLAFATQPTNGSVSVNLAPFTVRFRDVNNNLDFDTTRTVTLLTSGVNMSPATPSVTITAPHTGIATFSAISFTSGPQNAINLTATTTGLLTDNDDISNDFDILNFTYLAGDYRPNYAGSDFSSNGGWDSFDGTTWTLGVTAPQNLTAGTLNKPARIIIDKASITGGGSTNQRYNDIIIINGGELTFVDDDLTPALEIVFASKTIEVQSGGILHIEGDIDLPSTGNLIVRSGGEMIINQPSMVNNHPMWDGAELFEGGSTVTINDWDWYASSTTRALFNVSTSIDSNANGYKFGNLIIDVTTTDNWQLVGGPIGIINLTENDLDISNASTFWITGATNQTNTNGYIVNGNLTVYDGNFSFGSSYSSNPFNHQFTIRGNFENQSNDEMRLHFTGNGTPTNLNGSVTLLGDVIIGSTVTSFTNDGGTGSPSRIGMTMTGGTLADPNILDVAPIAVAVPMTIGNGSTATFVKLRTQDLVTNSVTSYTAPFTVTTNALLDFGYNTLGTTALNIRKTTTSPAGTNTFVSNTVSTLVITSPDGIQQASGTTGNVQYTSGNKTFNQLATFWYKGLANQVTGDALTTASNGKVLLVELNTLATTLTLTNGTGITNATSVDPLGGKLEIRQGTLVSSASAPITSGGQLIMTGGAYRIAELTTCPQLTGAYTLTGGTINLDGAGNQVLRGTRDYASLAFSTSGTKTLSSALTASSLTDLVTIQDAAILDVANRSFSGTSALNMTGTSRFRLSSLNNTLPELSGTYTLTGGTVELYGTGAGDSHSLRGTVTYNNVELNSTAATVGAGFANVVAGAGFGLRGAMIVNSPTCFQVASGYTISDAGTSSFTLAAGATLKYGATIDASGATGNIQTDTRTFPTTASYGFVGATAQTTGTGLPSSMVNMYIDKDASTDFVTLSSSTAVTGALTFYKGKLDIVAYNLTVDSSGSITGASVTDYVVTSSTGTLIRNIGGSGTFTYPIGSATAYNPSSFVWAAAPGITSYALRYIATTATTGSGLPASAGCVSAGTLVNNGHWVGTSVGIATNSPTITFTRNGHSNAGANLNLHTILRRNNTSAAWGVAGTWADPGITTISPASTGEILLTQTALATVNDFSGEFAIATGTNATSTAAVLSALAATICTGTNPNLSVAITGSGSFYDLSIFDGTSNFSVINYISGTPFSAPPTSSNKTYSITSVTIGGSCAGSGNSGSPTVNIGGTSTYASSSWTPSAPTATSTAVIDGGVYNVAANINACSLEIKNNAIVTIPSTYKVTLSGALTVANGSSFTLENDSNLVQTDGTSNPNTGSIQVKRNSSSLYLLDYTLWSSPVENQNLYSFSPRTLGNRFYVYDTPTNQYSPIASSNNFSVAKGYLIRVPKYYSYSTPAIYNGVFTGKPNSGTITLPMSLGGTPITGYGFNAVGNPYPSQINVYDFIDTNVNTTGVLYFWRKRNDQTQPSYATLTKIGYTANSAPGGGTANTFNYFNTLNNAANTWVINVGQGFFVQATAAANLVFTNAMRRGVNNSNQFFRTVNKTTSDVSLYKLNLSSSNGFFSQMLVGYSSDYTLGVDRGIDGSNINSEEYMCSSIDGVAYTIQGRPEFTPTDIVPLQYKIATADEYTITIEQFDGLFGTQDVYIKDKLTNFIHNLKTGPYTFGSESGLFIDRFEVVYENPLSTNDPHFNPNSVVVYKQNQDVVINTGTVQMSNVKIYDIRGRLLASKSNINASQVKLYAGTTNQVLIVKITSETNGVVTKKVIN